MLHMRTSFEWQASFALLLIYVCNLATIKHMLDHMMHAQSQKYAASRPGYFPISAAYRSVSQSSKRYQANTWLKVVLTQ